MVRLVLIALLAGCYRPSLVDCVDTCDQTQLCPEGLSCVGGFCTAGSSCAQAIDAHVVDAHVVDAHATDATTDAMTDAMTCPPPPSSCAAIMPQPAPPGCFTVCTTPATNMAAATFSDGMWHIAIINSPGEQGAAITAINASGQGEVWIGLLQNPSATAPGDGWHWVQQSGAPTYTAWATNQPDDGDNTENHEQDCTTMTSAGWYDQPCASTTRPFLIEPDPI